MSPQSGHNLTQIVAEAIVQCGLVLEGVDDPSDTEAVMARSFLELGFDSLNLMEFCIAISLETGIDLDVGKLETLRTPAAVVEFLAKRT